MDLDPSPASAYGDSGGCADDWPFDSLTTSMLFSSISASPQLPPLPAISSSSPWFTPPSPLWLTPSSPLWLFEDRHLLPIDAPDDAPDAAVAAAVVEEIQRARSGNSDASSKRGEQTNQKWQFHLSLDEDSIDNSSLFKERLTQALRYFKESTDQGQLVQVWAPVKNGDRYVLTTSGQPFVLDHQSIGLLQYRAVSMMYMFSVDGDNVGELGLPGRVYKQKVPEWTPNVQYYSSAEFALLNHAMSYNVHGTVALPVFDPAAQSCIAVIELIMTSKKVNYACQVDKVCRALEAVNLKSTEILDHPNVQICNEGRQAALVEILEILTAVCEEHKLPLAQTWVPCQYRSVLAHGGGSKTSCLSFDGSCMGEVCLSTSDVAFHVIDARMWGFRDACVEHHLQKGQGVSGKAFISHKPCFSKDIQKFCKLAYPLVHYARMFGLAGCFAICLQSSYTGNDHYILEFFLPPDCIDEDDQNDLLESILSLIKQCLRSLKVAGDRDSSGASLHLSNVLKLENEEFKTDAHFDNSDGSLRESPDGDRRGGAHKFDNGNRKVLNVTEGQLLTDDYSQDNGRPNGSGASDSSLLHKTNKSPKRRCKKTEKTISLEVLQQYFSGSLQNAAKSLGVCPATMKHICRQHGISRWPSRKINKVNRSLSKLKQVIESVQGSDAAFNLTSITGPLPTPVGPSSESLNVEKLTQSKVAELPNLAVDGDRDSLQMSLENDDHFDIVMAQQGFIDNNNDTQLEADKAYSRTSEGSCQQSPGNQTFVCKPIASTLTESQLNQEDKEPFQEPQLPLSRMLIEDSGISKDLNILFTSTSDQPFLAPPNNLVSMKHPGTVIIKASFKDDIVRFRFPCSGGVTVLKEEVAKRLRMDVGTFNIKYLDDDHEWVKLACNADLEECIEISQLCGSHVIRVNVDKEQQQNKDGEKVDEEFKKRKPMALRSDVWDSFNKVKLDNGEERARCKWCTKLFHCDSRKNGTSSLKAHLKICKMNPNKPVDNQGTLQVTPCAGTSSIDTVTTWKFDLDELRKSFAMKDPSVSQSSNLENRKENSVKSCISKPVLNGNNCANKEKISLSACPDAVTNGNAAGNADAEYIDSENLVDLPDVDAVLSTLLKRLDSKDWVMTCEALNNVRQLAMYHKEILQELLEPLVPLIVKLVKNPRSAVCKTALMTCADILKAYGDLMVDSIDPLVSDDEEDA